MKKTFLLLIAIFALPFFPQTSWAVQAYTSDTQEAPLRSGPSSQNRAMLNIPPGTVVEVLSANSYTKVRYTTPQGESKEGWVPSKFLGFRPPESVLAKELQAENRSLKERLETAEKERNDLAIKDKELSDKLAKLQTTHEALRTGSANYVQLKEEYDSMESALTRSNEHVQTLLQENESLKMSQQIKAFGAGAAVLLLGWIIGWGTGKRTRKRRPNYYFF